MSKKKTTAPVERTRIDELDDAISGLQRQFTIEIILMSIMMLVVVGIMTHMFVKARVPESSSGIYVPMPTMSVEANGTTFKYEIKGDNTVTILGYTGECPTVLTIPDSIEGCAVTAIGDYAFRLCESVITVRLPETVVEIGYHAFEQCSAMTVITLPKGLFSIGERAFADCASLKEITLPRGIKMIKASTFEGCISLINVFSEFSVVNICDRAFMGCCSLVYVELKNVKTIGTQAFAGCSSLTSVTIPESVTSIDDYSFFQCRSLTSISVPNSITKLGYGSLCPSRDATVDYDGTEEQWNAIDGAFDATKDDSENEITITILFADADGE